MPQRTPTPAMVLGLSPTGLYAVRELGQAGIPTSGISEGRQVGSASRYLALRSWSAEDENIRLESLLKFYKGENRNPVLIPTSDQDIDLVVRNADRLSECFTFQPSYMDTLAERILSKSSFYAECGRLGVAFPKSWCSGDGEISTLRGAISFPCLIKPSRIDVLKSKMAGKKGWVVHSAAEFDRIAACLPKADAGFVVQEIIPGPESEITLFAAYFDKQSEARQVFTGRKLRQYPPGFGSACLAVSMEEAETREIATGFLKKLGYKGIAAAEFKRDPRDGSLKMIEINPRPSLWFSLTSAAGKRITLAAYMDLTASEVLEERPQSHGVAWRYTLKDMYSSMFYKLNRNFVIAPPDAFHGKGIQRTVHPVFTREDPMPAAVELAHFCRKAISRITSSIIRA